MTDHHTYKKVELVGSSPNSIEDAINNALAEAHKSIKHLEWFEVTETGAISRTAKRRIFRSRSRWASELPIVEGLS
ncbi:hypothetical protein PBOI14_00590 [Pseudomonas sp. Boi14]|nr:hypothetical protein PBOI14_00590 [Pseudomonas sp. Boi14]